MKRRALLSMAGAAARWLRLLPAACSPQDAATGLKSMTGDVKPIERAEYLARIDKARALMGKHGIGALLIEPGASLVYFTGVQWWRSERLTARRYCRARATSPSSRRISKNRRCAKASRFRPRCACGTRTRIRSSPSPAFCATGKSRAPIAVEETVRFFAVDGLRRAMPRVEIRNGAPVVRGCRMIKSAAELALMQKAADITIAAYRHVAPRITRGMTRKTSAR